MALIECPECKTSVSDKANACVKCGYPLTATTAAPAAKPGPRFDGIYVSRAFTKSHGKVPGDWLGNMFRKMSGASYLRAYVRFFEDGLLVYAGGVVNSDPSPCRPTLDRTWGDENNRYHWSANDGQLRITSPNGQASSATLDHDRLAWDAGTSWMATGDDVFEFLAR